MEQLPKIKKIHSITIDSRRKGLVSGVDKVVSSCDTTIVLITSDGGLTIIGKELKINKFSIDDGALSFEGTIDTLKYTAAKTPLLKRLFK